MNSYQVLFIIWLLINVVLIINIFKGMYRSFLEGRDEEFDYSQIDSLYPNDADVIYERDAEERYFDSD